MNKKALRYSKRDIQSVSGRKLSHEEIQDRLFEMMCSFDSFCKKNDIEYYLTYGTLIGAVRHGGLYHGMMMLTYLFRVRIMKD